MTIHEAKTHLSRLIRRVVRGGAVVITRGIPVARLVPVTAESAGMRRLGLDAGLVAIEETFDEPLPQEVATAFTWRACPRAQ
ncbi:MAG: type II toxin-antitoxin system prevent-host-death family antitoxin [Armatimonadota bacterium]|nr:type II toxin-antitoxin system prevent-host-death family antitoxin [Armatimonadota bacterium]MDR7448088.1 type II toxin-antitoxin system prevent-host-death family antitoxin [Armatimonadota bacterium]MDR7459708.1 type II toxin-antitoxin system prevent-host-death family antitoxin [Armatimonadota bacterium]MDR7478300.1 type II toxin-antitoxin system prevent-host-death family antitoxin [Armatimonadota bacterium]MDR7487257.1 type II toxin-antitoxin system prevent-host-death family antitoxin [Arma